MSTTKIPVVELEYAIGRMSSLKPAKVIVVGISSDESFEVRGGHRTATIGSPADALLALDPDIQGELQATGGDQVKLGKIWQKAHLPYVNNDVKMGK